MLLYFGVVSDWQGPLEWSLIRRAHVQGEGTLGIENSGKIAAAGAEKAKMLYCKDLFLEGNYECQKATRKKRKIHVVRIVV